MINPKRYKIHLLPNVYKKRCYNNAKTGNPHSRRATPPPSENGPPYKKHSIHQPTDHKRNS